MGKKLWKGSDNDIERCGLVSFAPSKLCYVWQRSDRLSGGGRGSQSLDVEIVVKTIESFSLPSLWRVDGLAMVYVAGLFCSGVVGLSSALSCCYSFFWVSLLCGIPLCFVCIFFLCTICPSVCWCPYHLLC
jgi:hypothetical protein